MRRAHSGHARRPGNAQSCSRFAHAQQPQRQDHPRHTEAHRLGDLLWNLRRDSVSGLFHDTGHCLALAFRLVGQFQLLAGTQPFGGVLWFKFLGAQNSATHFIYDLNFYVDNPAAAQALEFNVTQSAGGNRYNFSTQCDLVGAHMWRVWDPVGLKWTASSVPCTQPAAKTWIHLVWEFERDSGDNVIFTAVTVNGSRGIVNLTMPHTSDTNSGVDIAYQSDANTTGTPYSVWLDKVNLTFW